MMIILALYLACGKKEVDFEQLCIDNGDVVDFEFDGDTPVFSHGTFEDSAGQALTWSSLDVFLVTNCSSGEAWDDGGTLVWYLDGDIPTDVTYGVVPDGATEGMTAEELQDGSTYCMDWWVMDGGDTACSDWSFCWVQGEPGIYPDSCPD